MSRAGHLLVLGSPEVGVKGVLVVAHDLAELAAEGARGGGGGVLQLLNLLAVKFTLQVRLVGLEIRALINAQHRRGPGSTHAGTAGADLAGLAVEELGGARRLEGGFLAGEGTGGGPSPCPSPSHHPALGVLLDGWGIGGRGRPA